MSKSKSRPKSIRHNFFDNLYVNVGDELINRENVWHFYAYFADEAAQILHEFMAVADITDDSVKGSMRFGDHPVKVMGKKQFSEIMGSLGILVDYYKQVTEYYDCRTATYKGREINFEHGDIIVSLLNDLHLFVNILPYLNERHYMLSQEKYEAESYHKYSFEELLNLDHSLAKRILPTFTWFAEHSIFCPKHLDRLFTFPRQRISESEEYNGFNRWRNALFTMVNAWEWLKNRKTSKKSGEWEDVPDEIYYGLHLFAEYLPEMQND